MHPGGVISQESEPEENNLDENLEDNLNDYSNSDETEEEINNYSLYEDYYSEI